MAFYPLEQVSRLYDGYRRTFKVRDHNLLLVQEAGHAYLIDNRCPHMDAPLENGALGEGPNGPSLRCKAHGIEFCLLTGNALGPLASTLDPLTRYVLVYEGNEVGVVFN